MGINVDAKDIRETVKGFPIKKVVLIVVLVMVLAATMLGGCGSQGGAQAEPEVAEPEVIKVKITADGKTNEVEVVAATVEEVLTEAS